MLRVNRNKLYWYIALLFLFVVITSFGIYQWMIHDDLNMIGLIIVHSFLVPWSAFQVLEQWEKGKQQFQTVSFGETHLIFDGLTFQGSKPVSVLVDYQNIKSIRVSYNSVSIQLVSEQHWQGAPCHFLSSNRLVPKKQLFTWSHSGKETRSELLAFLVQKVHVEKRSSFLTYA
jgi:hypothetical protein